MSLTQVTKAGLHEIALDHVFTVGASGTDHYTFQGEGLNGTVNDPTLYLTRGKTYRFEKGAAHPLRIQSTSGASGTAYNTGVTNNGGTGTVIVEVQHDAPDTLYYQCTSHPNMNGIIFVTGALSGGSVTEAKLADDAVTNAKIGPSAVGTTEIANDAVTGVKIQNSGSNDSLRAITTAHIKDANVTTAKLANDAVTTAKIATGAVTNTEIATGTISASRIVAGGLTTATLANDSVTTDKIPDDAITNAKLADDSVNSNNYVDGSINTAHIANSQITSAKIADANVTSTKLADNSVSSAKIANGTIVNADISTGAAIEKSKVENLINGNANNRVITGTDTTNSLQAESGLIYNGATGQLSVNASSGASARLSVVDDSGSEGFNVKHSNLSAGVGIGYDTIKAVGTNASNAINLRSKGDGDVNIGTDGHTVISVVSPERNFRVHGNHKGWSTLKMDDQNYGLRTHVRRINNGTNAVTTHNIARIKRTNWGWGYFELRLYSTYYYGSYVSIGYVMGHGNGSDAYSINRKKEIWTNNNQIGWGAEITKTSASSSSPGQSNAQYFDLQCTLPNYTYAVAEFIAYSSYKMTDADMSGTLDCYRLHTT